jgi:CBS domain-containing protein
VATTAREIMTPDPVCVRSSDSVRHAAKRMAELESDNRCSQP